MKIEYSFINGEHSEVEVNEEIGSYILDSRRRERNNDHTYFRHNYSLETGQHDGFMYAKEEEAFNCFELTDIIETLTEVEQRRLRLLVAGYTFREVAEMEGCCANAVAKSIIYARKKITEALKE